MRNLNRSGRFDRSRLPDPASFYASELQKFSAGPHFASACCVFHDDHHPSLVINLRTGRYECKACGASGWDILAFVMARDGLSFKEAVEMLDAWA